MDTKPNSEIKGQFVEKDGEMYFVSAEKLASGEVKFHKRLGKFSPSIMCKVGFAFGVLVSVLALVILVVFPVIAIGGVAVIALTHLCQKVLK